MTIYDLKDQQGRPFAFEVRNFGRSRAARLVARIPGVTVLRAQRHFQFFGPDEFCEFELEGQRFVIWEPFGDNGRYWVGAIPPRSCPQLERIRSVFASQRVWWFF